MNLIELLNRAEQIQIQLTEEDIDVTLLNKELEEIMDQVYTIIDDDKNWKIVSQAELDELNNEETENE
jgi:broad-specificity NMP kinase